VNFNHRCDSRLAINSKRIMMSYYSSLLVDKNLKLLRVTIDRLCEVSDQVQDKISNQMFKNDF
jgi:hypothetical protein